MTDKRKHSGARATAHARDAQHQQAAPHTRTRSQMGQMPPTSSERGASIPGEGASGDRKQRDERH